MSSNNCRKRAIIALAAGLLFSCGNGKREAIQKPYKNAIEFLLDADNNLLQSFQVVPLVAIRYQDNRFVMSMIITKRGEIFFDNAHAMVRIDSLQNSIMRVRAKAAAYREINDVLMNISCGTRAIDYAQMPAEYLSQVLRVLRKSGIKKISFGQLNLFKQSLGEIIFRPWNVEKSQIPRCDTLDAALVDSSQPKPDLTITRVTYSDHTFHVEVKNVGTADFAEEFWISNTSTKYDLIAGHYSHGLKVNQNNKKIKVNSSAVFQISAPDLCCYDIVRFLIDVDKFRVDELRYDNNCFDFDYGTLMEVLRRRLRGPAR